VLHRCAAQLKPFAWGERLFVTNEARYLPRGLLAAGFPARAPMLYRPNALPF
jgi:hypothetical protein